MLNVASLFYDDFYGIKWTSEGVHRIVTWSVVDDFVIVPTRPDSPERVNLDPGPYLSTFQQAFDLWDEALDHVTFVYTDEGNDADVTLGFTEIDGPDGIYAYWNATWSGGIFNKASIRFDPNDIFFGYLLTTALHEIGNILGLGDIRPTPTLQSVQEDPFPEKFSGNALWADDEEIIRTYYGETDQPTDLLYDGTGGRDLLSDGAGDSTLNGYDGADTLNGRAGDDRLNGNGGADRLDGGKGHDTLKSGGGNDRLIGGDHNDRLTGGDGNDALSGGDGKDVLSGNGGNDLLAGNGGRDTLNGGSGNDGLNGGTSGDKLNGGSGRDTLNGGPGFDVFVFSGTFGNDTITDFDADSGKEDIDLSGLSNIRNFKDLMNNHIAQVGSDVVIDAGNRGTITLLNEDLSDFGSGDFIF